MMSSTSVSPTDLAQSLPVSSFIGRHVDHCIHECNDAMVKFGYNPFVKMSLKYTPYDPSQPITDSRHTNCRQNHKQADGSKKNEIFLYCQKCTTHNIRTYKEAGSFRCCVIATVRFQDLNDEELPEGWPPSSKKMTVVELYPHPQECTVMEENKTKNTMSQSNLGLGYTKISLNVHNIMDDVFDDMKKIINSLTQKDLGETDSKYAKRITSGFLDSNPPDYRWMIPLTHGETEHDVDDQNDIDEYYGLRKQSFMQGMKHLRLRLMLCVANMLDLGDELPFVHSAHPDNVTPPTSIQDARHLNLTVPTCLMGGYARGNNGQTTMMSQFPHCDFAAVNGTTLSENSDLENKMKPCSLIIPLTEKGRTINFYKDVQGKLTKIPVRVDKDEILVFEGDVIHGGITYSAEEEPFELYPALHIYMESNLHKSDLSSFDIQTACCFEMEEFKPYVSHIDCDIVTEELGNKINALKNIIQMLENANLFNFHKNQINDLAKEINEMMLTGAKDKTAGRCQMVLRKNKKPRNK